MDKYPKQHRKMESPYSAKFENRSQSNARLAVGCCSLKAAIAQARMVSRGLALSMLLEVMVQASWSGLCTLLALSMLSALGMFLALDTFSETVLRTNQALAMPSTRSWSTLGLTTPVTRSLTSAPRLEKKMQSTRMRRQAQMKIRKPEWTNVTMTAI
jgi:hypothetical protein